MKTVVGAIILVVWFAWELAVTCFRTFVLGQSCECQMNAGDTGGYDE